MTSPVQATLAGTLAALAVSGPAALAAHILAAATDGAPPDAALVGLAAAVVAGAVIGGWRVRRRGGRWRHGSAAGALALGTVAALGVLRRLVADEGPGWTAVVAAAALGTLAGGVGWALARAGAARTRP